MLKVINEKLFSILRAKYGSVKVSNIGQSARITRRGVGKNCTVSISGGEYYRINCPKCSDYKHRLWISYLFGTTDSVSGEKLNHLATCYHCGANSYTSGLIDSLSNLFGKYTCHDPSLLVSSTTVMLEKCEYLDGSFVAINQLSLSHPVTQYVLSRGFDPTYLFNNYGFMFCEDSSNKFVSRRIYIPVVAELNKNLELVGSQTRAIPGFSLCEEPKYWTQAGFHKTLCLYNLHIAKDYSVVVLTEGVMDAIKVGKNAVCLFGKTISEFQVTLLSKYCSGKTICILLDSDAALEIVRIKCRLSKIGMLGGFSSVVPIMLSSGDPGQRTTEELQTLISNAIKKRL